MKEKTRKIVLASKSPRRKQILEQIGIEFFVHESEYDEDMKKFKNPVRLAKFLALKKAEDVAKNYKDAIIIGGDTFVVDGKELIGKPKNEKDAERILGKLSGKWHSIISGFAVIDTKNNIIINDFGRARVKFKKMSAQEIREYIATGEPMDKAGAYGILDRAAILIEKVSGDFFSVVGLPVCKVSEALKKIGVKMF